MAIKQEDFDLMQRKYAELKSELATDKSQLELMKRSIETDICILFDVPIEELSSFSLDSGNAEEPLGDSAASLICALGYLTLGERLNGELEDRMARYERFVSQAC